jgi:hypothetical protein
LSGIGIFSAIAVPAVLNIGGAALPTKNVIGLIDDIATSAVKHEPLPKALQRAIPDLVPLALTATGTAIPYVGVGIVVVGLVIKYSKPPTAEDQQRMWDQAQGFENGVGYMAPSRGPKLHRP